jgi:hypothetical protein
MSALKIVVFLLQASVAVAAGLAVARSVENGRAPRIIIVTLVWAASIIAPTYALAMCTAMTYPALVALSIALPAACVAALRPRRSDLWGDFRAMLVSPFAAMRLAWRERSLSLVGFAFAIGLVAWFAITVWYSPQRPDAYDPFWYHEPMVGFTIQNRSFSPVPMDDYMQRINGFPRASETLQLWFALSFGRRLIDATQLVFAPGMVAAVYMLCRRVTSDVVTSLGWGLVVFLMPTNLALLLTCHNDTTTMFFVIAGVWLVTHKALGRTHAAVAACALGLAVASKATCLMSSGVLSLVLGLRVIARRKDIGVRSAVVVLTAGGAFVLAMTCATYLRNYLNFHNPFWPEMKVDIASLGIHWPGRVPYRLDGPPPHPEAQIDENIPTPKLIEYMLALPGSVHEFQYGEATNYGIGVAWILLPLAIVGSFVLIGSYVIARVRALRGGPASSKIDEIGYLAFVIVLGSVLFWFSPERWAPRYHLTTVALAAVVVSALSSRSGWQRLGPSACGAALFASILNFYWAEPRYWVNGSELRSLVPLSSTDREIASSRSPYITADFGRLREGLREGDLLLARHYALVGLLWKNDYSNRVELVREETSLYDAANARNAACVVLRSDDLELPKFRQDARWRQAAFVERSNHVFLALVPAT